MRTSLYKNTHFVQQHPVLFIEILPWIQHTYFCPRSKGQRDGIAAVIWRILYPGWRFALRLSSINIWPINFRGRWLKACEDNNRERGRRLRAESPQLACQSPSGSNVDLVGSHENWDAKLKNRGCDGSVGAPVGNWVCHSCRFEWRWRVVVARVGIALFQRLVYKKKKKKKQNKGVGDRTWASGPGNQYCSLVQTCIMTWRETKKEENQFR